MYEVCEVVVTASDADWLDDVERRHPDGTPSVIVVPIIDGTPAYMQWVRNRTKIPK